MCVIFHYSHKKLKAFDKIDFLTKCSGWTGMARYLEKARDISWSITIKKEGHFKNSCKLAKFAEDSFNFCSRLFLKRFHKIFYSSFFHWNDIGKSILLDNAACLSATETQLENLILQKDSTFFAIFSTELYHSIEKLFTTWDFQQLLRHKIPGSLQRVPKRSGMFVVIFNICNV